MAIFTGNFYLATLAFIVSFLAVLITYLKWCFTYWKRKGVHTLPPSVPFGNAANIVLQREFLGLELKKVYDAFKAKGLKYGGYYIFGKPVFIPVDLDFLKLIMTKDFAHFTDRIFYVNSEAEPITAHLVSLKGSKWRNLRSKLTPTFSPGKMKMMFHTFVDCTKELTRVVDDAIKKNEAIDIKEVISRFIIDVIGLCAFGIECNSLKYPEAEFRIYGQKFFDTSAWDSFVRMMSVMTPEILHYVKFRTIRKDVTDFFTNVVAESINYREKNKIMRNDFLQLLIQLKNDGEVRDNAQEKFNETTLNDDDYHTTSNEQETSLTLEEIVAQCFVFFVGGYETSATTTTFCMYELVKNLELQNKLREEVNTVLARYQGKITYDALMEMTYMDKCVNEALRKYPPLPVLTRECTQTYKIPNSDVVIEKGSCVLIPTLGIQRDPELYPDPEKFDPERFSEEIKASRHPSTWIPFGDGPRYCIGSRLGVIQVKVGLTALLKDYKFRLNSRTSSPLIIDPKLPLVFNAKGGIWLDVEKIV